MSRNLLQKPGGRQDTIGRRQAGGRILLARGRQEAGYYWQEAGYYWQEAGYY